MVAFNSQGIRDILLLFYSDSSLSGLLSRYNLLEEALFWRRGRIQEQKQEDHHEMSIEPAAFAVRHG